MPILPLDHPEPFAATLGVMLYPRTDEADAAKARAFASQWLATPLERFHAAGYRLAYEQLAQISESAGEPLTDLAQRWWGGTATGELVKAYFALSCTDFDLGRTNRPLASWNNAVRVVELAASRARARGSRTSFWEAKAYFQTVAHLWGAWSIREGKFEERPEVRYDGYAEFQSFLTEAEILRDWGQNLRLRREGATPALPAEVWRVPDDWRPLPRQPDWPETGRIPYLALPADLLASLNPAGRPRKHA
jgi:hypothetical protein